MRKDAFLRVRSRIASAAERSGRDPLSVTLIGVTKGRTLSLLQEAVEAGIVDIGENRVQEAAVKFREFARPVRWHMIGHLQTNKTRDAVRIFDLIHSVDSRRLAQEIDKEAARINKVQEVLIEVKTSPEASKTGVAPQEAFALLEEAGRLAHIRVRGLMTIAPAVDAPEKARSYFRQLKSIFDSYNARGREEARLKELSMGMSDDFEVAIEEGATMVRIGRALFD